MTLMQNARSEAQSPSPDPPAHQAQGVDDSQRACIRGEHPKRASGTVELISIISWRLPGE